METDDKKEPESEIGKFARELGRGLVDEGITWLRWAGTGAMIGAVTVGAAGLYYFGTEALPIGIAVGAIVGGIGALILYVALI